MMGCLVYKECRMMMMWLVSDVSMALVLFWLPWRSMATYLPLESDAEIGVGGALLVSHLG
jgi:tryptophan-rich sensory protein